MTTTNLNLFTYSLGSDGDIGFDDLRSFINGSGSSSNMMKIDNWAFQQPIVLSSMLSSFSGSKTLINGSLNSIDGILGNSASQISELDNRFTILGTFSGSGQADFSNISQNYKNLIILGVASSDYSYGLTNIGIDFNGDISGSAYSAVQYDYSGSRTVDSDYRIESISSSAIGQILLGKITGNSILQYGGTVIGIIPNYSESGGFYKTSMGFSALTSGSYQDTNPFAPFVRPQWSSVNLTGGVWKNNVPINRVRIFGSSGSSKYNFLDGTVITLYGFK